MRTPRALAAVAIVGVLALGACAPEPPVPTEEPTVTESAAPAPAESPEATAPPAVDDLVLRPDGLGLLVIGEPAPAPSDPTAMIEFIDDYCVSDALGIAPGDPSAGAWVAVSDYSLGGEGGTLFGVAVDDAGIVQAVQVFGDPTIPTESGIRVGSTLAEFLAAYPGASGPGGESALSQFYLVDGPGGRLVVEVATEDASSAGYWEPALVDTVLGMTAVQAGSPGFTIAASDGGLGGCPL